MILFYIINSVYYLELDFSVRHLFDHKLGKENMHFALATVLLWVGSAQAFTVKTCPRASCTQLHSIPPPNNEYGGLTSTTSNLKPGRNYAPTQPGVKHSGSREEGYLGNLQRAGRGEVYSTPSYAAGGFAPVSSASTQSATVYHPAAPVPAPEPTVPTEPPKIVTALLTADGVGGRLSSSILFNARSDALNYLDAPGAKMPGVTKSVELRNAMYAPPPAPVVSPPPAGVTNERAYIKSGGMTNIPPNARVYLKGDGEASRSEQGAELTMNQANIDRVPVVAATAPMHVRSAMANGYDSQLVRTTARSSRPSSFAPTQSDVKFKSASTGSSYLDGLNQQSQVSYRSPTVTRMSDPFAQPKMAAHAVSGLLHADPRSGESFSSDPFAISRKAADAVSLLLLKYTEPKDAVFYLT